MEEKASKAETLEEIMFYLHADIKLLLLFWFFLQLLSERYCQ